MNNINKPINSDSFSRMILNAFDIWASTVFTDIASSSAISWYFLCSILLRRKISLHFSGNSLVASSILAFNSSATS